MSTDGTQTSPHSNRRGLVVFAAILAAAGLFVWTGEQWQQQHNQISQDFIDDLCATTPDC